MASSELIPPGKPCGEVFALGFVTTTRSTTRSPSSGPSVSTSSGGTHALGTTELATITEALNTPSKERSNGISSSLRKRSTMMRKTRMRALMRPPVRLRLQLRVATMKTKSERLVVGRCRTTAFSSRFIAHMTRSLFREDTRPCWVRAEDVRAITAV